MTKKSVKQKRYIDILAGGEEPNLKGKVFTSTEEQSVEVEKAMYWYRQNFKMSKAKEWVAAYLVAHNRAADVGLSVRGKKTDMKLIAPYCRLVSRGWIPNGKYSVLIESGISALLSSSATNEMVVTNNIQSHIQKKANLMLGEFEPILDELYESAIDGNVKKSELVGWIKKNKWSRPVGVVLFDRVCQILADLDLARSEKDAQLVEAYSYITPIAMENIVAELGSAKKELETIISELVSNRKPRKRKIKSVEQILKGLKYCEKSIEYGIASCATSDILGCQYLLMFNVKNKRTTFFVASEPARGLSIMGSTVVGFGTIESMEKIIRNPVNFIQQIQKSKNDVQNVKKYIHSLKTKQKNPNGRINKHCVILQTWDARK